jgi:hypothetical protein
MIRHILLLIFLFIGGNSYSHQFTPTYPELKQSIVSDILKAEMKLFNTRKDVEYYELQVFNDKWKALAFATQEKIIKVEYLKSKTVNVYIRSKDKNKVMYICSISRVTKEKAKHTIVSSRICSKIKR